LFDLNSKISDFGLSRVLNENQDNKTKRVGTALYTAPEIVISTNYDQRCDIFSFSIIMFQILTKKIENIYMMKNMKIRKFL
jgi:serine/threonine protein kinase